MGEERELKKKLKIKSKSKGFKKNAKINEEKNLVEFEKNSSKQKEDGEKVKLSNKRKQTKIKKNSEDRKANHFDGEDKTDEVYRGKKKRKVLKNKGVENEEKNKVEVLPSELKESFDGNIEAEEKGSSKLRQKKRKGKKMKKAETAKVEEFDDGVEGTDQQNDDANMEALQNQTQAQMDRSDADTGTSCARKSKKVRKAKKKDHLFSQNEDLLEDPEANQDGVYEMSSGDEDCSKGMKKWIMEYHQSRPGVEILQEWIDDFITSHEAQQEQERKEREARAAEGGWTVVVHHKGRKKTTESESGTAVGAAHATVTDKIGKKKNKVVGLDFYRFQRREAQRSEIMMLQSKFEQDKKRIQQMRAARKFKPY